MRASTTKTGRDLPEKPRDAALPRAMAGFSGPRPGVSWPGELPGADHGGRQWAFARGATLTCRSVSARPHAAAGARARLGRVGSRARPNSAARLPPWPGGRIRAERRRRAAHPGRPGARSDRSALRLFCRKYFFGSGLGFPSNREAVRLVARCRRRRPPQTLLVVATRGRWPKRRALHGALNGAWEAASRAARIFAFVSFFGLQLTF
jgi:hypothetical protein